MRESRGAWGYRRPLATLLALALLATALVWGRTRAAPEVEPLLREIFPEAGAITIEGGIHRVHSPTGALLGWAALGEARGYGGPLSLLVALDTLGKVAGVRVVEERETPIFWRMARAPEYFRALAGRPFDEIPYDYQDIVSVTGATLSTNAIVESLRTSIARVAEQAFDVRVPLPRRPFEFGFLEIAVLALFAVGAVGHRLRGPLRKRLRWGAQVTGLVVLGFWKDSPITLAKIAALLSGFFPDPRTGLALYILLAGFLVTSILYGRNLYCLYACPFGAAQRVVGAIGGFRLRVPPRTARILTSARNIVTFAALFLAFLTLQPVVAGYEPFAALFSLHGSTLQWFLLFLVLVASLFLTEPWCAFLCPMGAVERTLQQGKRWIGRGKAPHPGSPARHTPDFERLSQRSEPTAPSASRSSPDAGSRRAHSALSLFLGLLLFGIVGAILFQNLLAGR